MIAPAMWFLCAMQRIGLFMVMGLILNGCVPFNAVIHGIPDEKDILRFASTPLLAGDTCFQFHRDETGIGQRIKVNEWGSGIPFFMPLEELMARHAVRSMVVIRNDTILYEGYGKGMSATDVHASYSVAKSFTSALIGIAISEGDIGSVREMVTTHIPELKGITGAEYLRIEHLLNMTSGIRNTMRNNAIIYYGRDVKKALGQVEFAHTPGTFQEYINLNVQLLGIILHRATGMMPADYMTRKLWQPLGMCANGLWTRDKHGENLTFCCMGATALDYAKFGRLYLHRGQWNGKSIIDEQWVNRSVTRDTTEGSSFNYNYGWHIGDAAYGDYMADGMYKQYIYVQPSKNIIIVLLCNRENALKAERTQWRNIFHQVVDQL